jgi:hypothetical protein
VRRPLKILISGGLQEACRNATISWRFATDLPSVDVGLLICARAARRKNHALLCRTALRLHASVSRFTSSPPQVRRRNTDMLTNSGHKRIALLFDLSVGYCRDVLEGIQRFARERNDWVYFDAPPTMESQHALRAYHPHGIIAHVFDAEFAREIVALGVPAVTSTSTLIDSGLPIVEVDHWQVGRMAAEFFLARGFRRFWFLREQLDAFFPGRVRRLSYRRSRSMAVRAIRVYEEFSPSADRDPGIGKRWRRLRRLGSGSCLRPGNRLRFLLPMTCRHAT